MKKHLKSTLRILKNAPLIDSFAPHGPQSPLVRIPRKLKGRGPRRLVLHVGAHKTGTSSLQTMLRSTGDQLAEQGVFAFARHLPRTPWNHLPAGRRGYDLLVRPSLDTMLRESEESAEFQRASKVLASRLEDLAGGAPTILYSDEALMGKRLKNYNGLYPHAEKQLRAFMQSFPDRQVSVVLYIRDQAKYIESSYLQSVKEGNACRSFEEFLEKRVDLDQLSWMDLADRISSVVGDGALVVERFERIKEGGFLPFARRFLSRYVKTDGIKIEDVHANPALSARGVEISLKIRRGVTAERWKLYRNMLGNDFPAGVGAPAPKLLTKMQKKELAVRYAGDCEATEAKYSGRRTRP